MLLKLGSHVSCSRALTANQSGANRPGCYRLDDPVSSLSISSFDSTLLHVGPYNLNSSLPISLSLPHFFLV